MPLMITTSQRHVRLGDLREGRCEYGFFYNSVACCSGLDGRSSLSCYFDSHD